MPTEFTFARHQDDLIDDIEYRLRFFYSGIETIDFSGNCIHISAGAGISEDSLSTILNQIRRSNRRTGAKAPTTEAFCAETASILSFVANVSSQRLLKNIGVARTALDRTIDNLQTEETTPGPDYLPQERSESGHHMMSGNLARLVRFSDNFVREYAELAFSAEDLLVPSSISFENLQALGFLESSSQQLVYVSNSQKEPECFSKLQKAAKKGFHNFADVQHLLNSSGRCLNPALCLHVYPLFHEHAFEPHSGTTVTVSGRCFRDEGGNVDDRFRLAEFSMREIVCIGASDWVDERFQDICVLAWVLGSIFDDDYSVCTASDIFFDQNAGMRKSAQLLQSSKLELRAGYARRAGVPVDGGPSVPDMVSMLQSGDALAAETFVRFENRLARSLAVIINVLDPGVIVFGGGLSNIDRLYEVIPDLTRRYAHGEQSKTKFVRNMHGDSSGVRGAAWL